MTERDHLPALDEMREAGLDDEQIALRVWALACDRNHAKTSRFLTERYAIEVKPNTIAVWAKRHDWNALADDLFRVAAPQKLQRMAVRALNASEDAWAYLEDVAAGRAPVNEKGEIDKGRATVCLELVRIVGFVAPKASDVSLTGTSFQRSLTHAPHDDLSNTSTEDIEAQLRQRGIRIDHAV